MEQKAGGYLDVNVQPQNPDSAAMANACGLLGIRVNDSDQVEAALAQAYRHDGPALVDIRTASQELEMPPAVELEQVKG